MRPVGGNLGLARTMLSGVREAVDAGELPYAEELLEHVGRQIPAEDLTYIANELRLTVLLERSTLHQQRADFTLAEEVATNAVKLAEQYFDFGLQHGRAQLRLLYVWESQGMYRDAQDGCFELAERLSPEPDTVAIRLSCLTRALASALKNTDRGAQERAVAQAAELVMMLDERDAREILAWFYYWCGLAQIRQNQREEGRWLLSLADRVASPIGVHTWRWKIVMGVAIGNLLLITQGREDEGRRAITAARTDAERQGFRYLVRAITAVFKHLDPDAE